jgi:pentatricopeptide repeat protein
MSLTVHEQLRALGRAGDWEAALKLLRSNVDWDLENDALRRENEKLRTELAEARKRLGEMVSKQYGLKPSK